MTRTLLLAATVGTALLSAQTPVERSWSALDAGLGAKSVETRANAIRALGLIANNAKAQQLAETALADPKPELQAAAAQALGQMGAKSSAPKLFKAVKSTDTEVVFAATNALFTLGDPR